MTEQTATIVIGAGFGVGLTVWIVSFVCYVRLVRTIRGKMQDALDGVPQIGANPQEWLVGTKSVNLPAAEVHDNLLKSFTEGALSTLYEVEERGPDEVFIRYSSSVPMRYNPIACFQEARLKLKRQNGGTLAFFAVHLGRNVTVLHKLTAVLLWLGLVVVLALPIVLYALCARSADANVRGQSIQILQMCHLLWPPFLTMHLYRVSYYRTQTLVELMLTSAPDALMGAIQSFAGRYGKR